MELNSQINSVNGQVLHRVVMCGEDGVKHISVRQLHSATSSQHTVQDIPITNPALAPNSIALRIDNRTFEIRRLRMSSSASGQDLNLTLPVPGSVHSHSVGR